MAPDQLRGRLAPPVRLAPLEQGVDGAPPRAAALLASPARARLRPIALGASAEHPLQVEAVGALLVGGDRGVGERAAGRRSAGRRSTSGGGPSPSSARRLGLAAHGVRSSAARSGEGEVDAAPRSPRARSSASSPGRGSGGGDRHDRSSRRRGRPRSASTSRSITGVPGFVSRPALGLTTPLRISRSRARVAATWKSRSSSSASRSLRLLAELARSRRG